jgi:hypothetical protein
MRAPLGDKGCSYKAHVRVFNAEGDLVAGEDAPMFGSDTKTGKPIISYDGGKTWDWYSGTVPNPKPKSVRVFGSKSSRRKLAARLGAMRGPGESHSDVILWLASESG